MADEKKVKYSDLFLVAYLSSRGHEVIASERNPNKRVEFIFNDSEVLQHDVLSFIEDDIVELRLRTFAKRYKDFMFFVHAPGDGLLKATIPQIEKGDL